MNRYLVASILPLAFVGHLSYSAVKANAHSHRKNMSHHTPAVVKVNINTANSAQLSTLKGIGVKRAESIVSYRKAHGPFASINALTQIKGISNKKIAAIEKQGLAYTTAHDRP